MSRVRREPWSDFAEWLTIERGLASTSISTYISQVRRALREVPDLDGLKVARWINALPVTHRGSYRASYRAFGEWLRKERHLEIPELPSIRAERGFPVAVLSALHVLRADGLTTSIIQALRWSVDKDGVAAKAYPHLVFFIVPGADGILVLRGVSRAAAAVLKAWAYPDSEPGPTDPVVPIAPASKEPVSLTSLRMLLGKTPVYAPVKAEVEPAAPPPFVPPAIVPQAVVLPPAEGLPVDPEDEDEPKGKRNPAWLMESARNPIWTGEASKKSSWKTWKPGEDK